MDQKTADDDCVSKKPWGEVLSRSLKLFTFNAAREGGRSFGRVVFYILLGLIILFIASYIIDSLTGWFSAWFDFWPFNRADSVAEAEEQGWFNWSSKDEVEPVQAAIPEDGDTKWYCKWNPIC